MDTPTAAGEAASELIPVGLSLRLKCKHDQKTFLLTVSSSGPKMKDLIAYASTRVGFPCSLDYKEDNDTILLEDESDLRALIVSVKATNGWTTPICVVVSRADANTTLTQPPTTNPTHTHTHSLTPTAANTASSVTPKPVIDLTSIAEGKDAHTGVILCAGLDSMKSKSPELAGHVCLVPVARRGSCCEGCRRRKKGINNGSYYNSKRKHSSAEDDDEAVPKKVS